MYMPKLVANTIWSWRGPFIDPSSDVVETTSRPDPFETDLAMVRTIGKNVPVQIVNVGYAVEAGCYANALRTIMMRQQGAFLADTYVLGFAGVGDGIYRRHAWNRRNGEYIDVTPNEVHAQYYKVWEIKREKLLELFNFNYGDIKDLQIYPPVLNRKGKVSLLPLN